VFDKILFISAALATIVGAVLTISVKNLMHAAVFLLLSLLGVAGLYLTLGADFVAVIQLVVYVGGVVVLMVFAVMLTAGSNGQKANRFGLVKIPTMGNFRTYTIGIVFAALVLMTIIKLYSNVFAMSRLAEIPAYYPTVSKIGISLVSTHVLAFEISSVLLLGALVGAAIVSRPRREKR
jgi:NADH:ubiquinone oxidoreductase subunit 6 (subunit J)